MFVGKVLGLMFAGLLALFVYLYFYLGFFLPVTITVEERGPYQMVYKDHAGAYHQIGPTIGAVEKWATDQNLRCPLTFGEYLDDPAAIDQDRLRSRGGCLFDKVGTLKLPEDFAREERPRRRYVIAHFSGSPSIGPFKVYPKVQEFVQAQRLKQNGAVIEAYLVNGQSVTTEFLFPVE